MSNDSIEETLREIESHFTGRFLIKRKNSTGIIQEIDTVFDTAVIALELYKLTKNPKYLQVCFSYFQENAVVSDGKYRWKHNAPRSQSTLPSFPPDGDSTALTLLVFYLAEQENISVPIVANTPQNRQQFQELQHPHGIKTWFDNYRPEEEPDPVVTSAVALFFIYGKFFSALYDHLQEVINEQVKSISEIPEATSYYPSGRIYFAARAAEIEIHKNGYLEQRAKNSLDDFLRQVSYRNPLEAAWVGTAAALREMKEKADEAREYLIKTREQTGFWPWVPFYNQKTYWQYGHEVTTTVYAMTALCTIREVLKRRCP